MLILPGRTEYVEKFGLVVSDLAATGRGALVVDWRGQGPVSYTHLTLPTNREV